ncbi:protein deacetylase HDAC6 [Rhinophrynus dorsalis]
MASPKEIKPPGPRGVRGSSRSPGLPAAPTKKPSKKGVPSPQGPNSLQEIKKRGYKMRQSPEKDLCDQLEGLELGTDTAAEGTGLVYDERMAQTYCLWDDKFPECPARMSAVKEKLAEYGLMERCVPVPAREASEEEILHVHSPQFVELMKSTQWMNVEALRAVSDLYDSVYLHPTSFTCSSLAAGSVLQLVDKVMGGEIRNGLAVVRPPGHHAHTDQMNGYCMFNQLAIAARYAQRTHHIKRVLIVDWDVHHGQGTQFIFENDPSVLYFSIHRYENGSFWPHLIESSSSAVGKDRGERYNINVAWNKTGMTDADYVAAFLHILLPVAYEFNPQLVLVAAGFDSVVGDPKGEMSASPACFSHLTHLLMSLAQGRLVLSLEGGYNLRSLAEGVCASLKILLGDPCPKMSLPFLPCQSALDSVSDTITAHRKFWKVLVDQETEAELPPEQECGENPTVEVTAEPSLDVVLDSVMQEVMRKVPEQRTGLVYDEQMMEHYNMWDSYHPEVPQRISQILKRHKEMGLLDRCQRISHRLATEKELQMCHSLSYIKNIEASAHMKPRDLHRLGSEYDSIYVNSKSYNSACLAAGSTFNVVEAVLKGKIQNGVCIVRPPGHHAEPDAACGFCFFNTVGLAARYAQSLQSPSQPPLRVMILDWDVHHGNGTQHIFQDDASVLYMSLHRYDDGLFFPNSEDASHDQVGIGKGEGFNVNIPWNGGKMGDPEYLTAFHRVVMPIAYEFNPQLVLISAGFDAARGDPLGGCHVSPEGYAHMTHLLMGLAGGRVVMVLEGGYNLTSISESMAMCTRALLGDPPPPLSDLRSLRPSALRSIRNVLQRHRRYWRSLWLNVTGPPLPIAEVSKGHHVTPKKFSPRKGRFTPETGPSPQTKEVSPGEKTLQLEPAQGDLAAYLTDPVNTDSNLEDLSPEICEHSSSESTPTRSSREDSSGAIETLQCAEEYREQPVHKGLVSEGKAGQSPQNSPQPAPGSEQWRLDLTHQDQLLSDKENVLLHEMTDMEPKTPDLPIHEVMKESPTEEILNLRDLKLGDDGNGCSLPVTEDFESDPGLVGGARRKTLPPAGGGEGTVISCEETSKGEMGFSDTCTDQELLSEAAGGCDPGTSHTLCQLFIDPLLEDSGAGFAVTPLSWCPHLKSVCSMPVDGLDVKLPCAECGSDLENWVCLSCYKVLCGRYISQHMLAHGVTEGHNLVLSFSDFSVWCYGCEAYVHHQTLIPAKSSAYYSKFGEEMPAI